MKINKLIIENLNSLYGHWEINFDDPAFDDGIFAITGKTGTGKSTILDAICLALYAQTPRTEDVKTGDSRNIVLSIGASSCRAELAFTVENDVGFDSYNARFSLEFPKRRRKSTVQQKPSIFHGLYRNGVEIATQIKPVQAAVTELLGMDFAQFQRAALLAQGRFDAFLSANETEQSQILEKITGTDRYSAIAQQVQSIKREQDTRLELLQAAVNGIQLLDETDEAAKRAEHSQLGDALKANAARLTELDALAARFTTLQKDRAALDECTAAQRRLEVEREGFAAEAKRLEDADRADAASPAFQKAREIRREQEEQAARARALSERLPGLDDAVTAARTASDSASNLYDSVKRDGETLAATINEVVALDSSITEKQRQIDACTKGIDVQTTAIRCLRDRRDAQSAELARLVRDNEAAAEYVKSHAEDAALDEHYPSWLAAVGNLRNAATNIRRAKRDSDKAAGTLETAKAEHAAEDKARLAALQRHDSALHEQQEAEARLKSLYGQYTPETLAGKRDDLRKILFYENTVKSLTEERANLREGQECPLCGSRQHPFCHGEIPRPDKTRRELDAIEVLIAQCNDGDKALQKATMKASAAQDACVKALESLTRAEQLLENETREAKEKADELAQLTRERQEMLDALRTELGPFGFTLADNASVLPASIKARMDALRDNREALAKFDASRQKLEADIANVDATIAGEQRRLDELRTQNEQLTAENGAQRDRRHRLFGDKLPAQEADRARRTREVAEAEARKAADTLTAALRDRETAGKELNALNESIGIRTQALKAAENAFQEACRRIGMSPDVYLASVLSEEEKRKISERKTALETQRATLDASITRLKQAIAKSSDQIPPATTPEGVADALTALKAESGTLNQRLGELNNILSQNDRNRALIADHKDDIERQNNTCVIWNKLNELIGKGDKFRRIAQGITLSQLLGRANVELAKMNGRYELYRDENTSSVKNCLGIISVIDHFEGDIIRPTSNLSGGEKFIVSLALALGLSSMQGTKIKLGSLFLDEGFGNLDADALANTLKNIAKLRMEGKLVGIISHVADISEDIDCRIQVTAIGAGRSKITGPGVSNA